MLIDLPPVTRIEVLADGYGDGIHRQQYSEKNDNARGCKLVKIRLRT
jgi:hypothetical protein